MVWAKFLIVGRRGCVLWNPGAKINSEYNINNILKPFRATDTKRLYHNRDFVFHQDSAPSHAANRTLQFFADNGLQYITPAEWMPQSPDAAPMDYFVWGYLKQQMFKRRIKTLAGLKRAVIDEWKKMPQEMINKALDAWPKRCRRIYNNRGLQIENQKWNAMYSSVTIKIQNLS